MHGYERRGKRVKSGEFKIQLHTVDREQIRRSSYHRPYINPAPSATKYPIHRACFALHVQIFISRFVIDIFWAIVLYEILLHS